MSFFVSWIVLFLAYLLGSVPFGLLLTKLAGLGDIRGIGSGNIGATNVLRTGKKGLALLTLLLDGGKGVAAVLLAAPVAPGTERLAGLAVLLGHLYPVWLRFKGGKGVATSFGVLTALAWPVGLGAMLIWLLTAAVFRYSSLAALVSVGLAPGLAFGLGRSDLVFLSLLIVLFVFIKHAANIRRLMKGTEPKIGQSRDDAASGS
ncbi:MAG: glycerol-3-phosphate 1-O-acyltransferase PlsY [Alphaproteobacteria bacterium]|nr:glycerol-3-phosphate 1-O-acyltransferase PlsY [Alphaproteobacteria bacterium]